MKKLFLIDLSGVAILIWIFVIIFIYRFTRGTMQMDNGHKVWFQL